jgi:hypothetical protein
MTTEEEKEVQRLDAERRKADSSLRADCFEDMREEIESSPVYEFDAEFEDDKKWAYLHQEK